MTTTTTQRPFDLQAGYAAETLRDLLAHRTHLPETIECSCGYKREGDES